MHIDVNGCVGLTENIVLANTRTSH